MNRSALCLKMLNLLKARGKMKASELAAELDTNVRNIYEFKKELEVAGYHLRSTQGSNGGYELVDDELLPTLKLNNEEVAAVKSSLAFLKGQRNFYYYQDYRSAMDKVLASTKVKAESNVLNFSSNNASEPQMLEFLKLINHAISGRYTLKLTYQSLNASSAKEVIIEPYGVFYWQNANYLIAFSKSAKALRTYKVSPLRMLDLVNTNKHFSYDDTLNITNYLKNDHLFFDKEIYELIIEVDKASATLLLEKNIGLIIDKVQTDNGLRLKLIMSGKTSIIAFLLSLGHSLTIIEPLEIKELYKLELKKIITKLKEG